MLYLCYKRREETYSSFRFSSNPEADASGFKENLKELFEVIFLSKRTSHLFSINVFSFYKNTDVHLINTFQTGKC